VGAPAGGVLRASIFSEHTAGHIEKLLSELSALIKRWQRCLFRISEGLFRESRLRYRLSADRYIINLYVIYS